MSSPEQQIKLVKQLREKQASAATQTATDEAQLKVFEQQREALYNRCRELNVQPENIKDEILTRTQAIDDDLTRIKQRFDSLQGGQNGE